MEENFFSKLGACKKAPSKRVRTKPGNVRPAYEFDFVKPWHFGRATTPQLHIAPDFDEASVDADMCSLAGQASRPLSGLEADLIWLATAVYVADRCSPRFPYGNCGPAYWRRRIHLKIAVSDTARWDGSALSLCHALEFLTEDDWSFEFVLRGEGFEAEHQQRFERMQCPEITGTALFSGGLDSLAGALQWLSRGEGAGLFVSGQTNSRIAVGQQAQIDQLRKGFPKRVEHVGLAYGFPNKRGISGFESTQRTRAFIHTSLGSVAAVMAGNSRLFLFENGFGALNLPCDAAQIGSQNSRGTHPVFLTRMSAFLSALFSEPFMIANPFTFSTKAQMMASHRIRDLASLLGDSFSCDRFPNYNHPQPQCGFCPSCLVRRLSFHASGLEDSSAGYTIDVFKPHRAMREAELIPLAKLSAQADSLATCLSAARPWPALCAKWPDLLRTEIEMGSEAFPPAVMALLTKHVEEWNSFASSVHPRIRALAA
jgi:hypothetical protein